MLNTVMTNMMRTTICICVLLNYSIVFAQTQEQPKQTGLLEFITERMPVSIGTDVFNGNSIHINNPVLYIDMLYRSKSKSFMSGLEFESSFFYNGADKQRSSNTPNYINKSALGIVAWYRVVKKEKAGFFGDQIYLGGGISSSPDTNTFDYTRWMAGVQCDYGETYIRFGYRYYNFIGTENQNMVFLTFGITF
ncbi:MAG: hypothetical protein ORN85_02560 [Sediminibacterium sp.]|nr:hypothetical protein [Sediminibacterium sp.]